jgi:hypothetical protein
MEKKTHYRKVFKSDHLGIADLEDFIEEKKPLVFTIREVKQEINVSVAGKKGSFNIAYFVEKIKPLVLNATNSKTVKLLAGGSPFVEDWKNISVELYIDEQVKMKGDTVGGVRIRSTKPVLPFLSESSKAYQNAVAHLVNGGSLKDIEARFQLSPEITAKLKSDANTI